jgi:SAM-dependent methyltransferase
VSEFAGPADSYERFMGRYATPLAPLFADFAGVEAGQRVLDVGCGTGALTAQLVRRVGAAAVSAVDPSAPYLAAARARCADADVQLAAAEELPYGDRAFDAVLGQLVVHFLAEPARALGEMRRVARSGGVIAACVWDHGGGGGPLESFWAAARALDPDVHDESGRPGTRRGQLRALLEACGLTDVRESSLSVSVAYRDFESWWEPFTLGVGPAGTYYAGLDATRARELRCRCREAHPTAPITIEARAWTARGRAP